MTLWKRLEADSFGVISEEAYSGVSGVFPVCPPVTEEAAEMERSAWRRYLSACRGHGRGMYEEMYRYEWYEGKRRKGFWGGIEKGIASSFLGKAPKVPALSAGSGRDLLKVGLAAGIWRSVAPRAIRGTWLEIDPKRFRLEKSSAKIFATEYSPENLERLKSMA